MANAYSGFAAVLQMYVTSSFTTIAAIRDIAGPTLALNTVEVSTRDSAWRKFAATMIDGGEVTFDIVYDPDTATHGEAALGGLVYALEQRRREQFKLSFADSTPATATFYGFVTRFQPKTPMDGAQTADVTLKIDGSITWA